MLIATRAARNVIWVWRVVGLPMRTRLDEAGRGGKIGPRTFRPPSAAIRGGVGLHLAASVGSGRIRITIIVVRGRVRAALFGLVSPVLGFAQFAAVVMDLFVGGIVVTDLAHGNTSVDEIEPTISAVLSVRDAGRRTLRWLGIDGSRSTARVD